MGPMSQTPAKSSANTPLLEYTRSNEGCFHSKRSSLDIDLSQEITAVRGDDCSQRFGQAIPESDEAVPSIATPQHLKQKSGQRSP